MNPEYQDVKLALQTRNSEIPESRSFVTVHISGNKEFELNVSANDFFESTKCQRDSLLFIQGTDGEKFVVTRRISKKYINFVYISCNGSKQQKQPIVLFHNQLNLLQFTRIGDVFISEHTNPTSYDLNTILICALDFTELVNIITQNDSLGLENMMYQQISGIWQVRERSLNDAKEHLTLLRTLETAILMNRINALNSKTPNESHTARNTQREISFSLLADKFETIQRRRFNSLKDAYQVISEEGWEHSSIDLAEFNDSFEEFMVTLEKFEEDLKHARKIKCKVEKYVQITQMKVFLRRYFNERVTIREFINVCDKQIEGARRRLQTLHQNMDYQESKRKAEEILKEIKDLHLTINDGMGKLNALGQKVMNNKIRWYFTYAKKLNLYLIGTR